MKNVGKKLLTQSLQSSDQNSGITVLHGCLYSLDWTTGLT